MKTLKVTMLALLIASGIIGAATSANAQAVSVQVQIEQPTTPAYYYRDGWGRLRYAQPRLSHERIENQIIDRDYE